MYFSLQQIIPMHSFHMHLFPYSAMDIQKTQKSVTLCLHILLMSQLKWEVLSAAVASSQLKKTFTLFGNFDLKLVAELMYNLELTGLELLSLEMISYSILSAEENLLLLIPFQLSAFKRSQFFAASKTTI